MDKDIALGIFSWFGYVMPFRKRLKLIKQAGFDATCIWWEDEEGLNKDEMPQIARDTGLIIDNIHLPFCDSNALWSENEYVRRQIVRKHIEWLEDCAKYNIPIMVMHLSEGDLIPRPNKYGLESMQTLTKIGEDLGVKIAMENTLAPDNIPFLLSHIFSDYLGFCLDTSHANLTRGIDTVLLEKYGTRLFTTHISDNDGLEDRHWVPGKGEIDWDRLATSFPKDYYKGNLILEVCPKFEKEPEEFLAKAFRSISNIKSMFFKEI